MFRLFTEPITRPKIYIKKCKRVQVTLYFSSNRFGTEVPQLKIANYKLHFLALFFYIMLRCIVFSRNYEIHYSPLKILNFISFCVIISFYEGVD